MDEKGPDLTPFHKMPIPARSVIISSHFVLTDGR